MKVGDTFLFEGEEYSIKNIDFETDDVRFLKGRIDASKFVGEGIFKKIQKGRPKAFKYEVVAEIMGETPESTIESDVEIPEEVSESWEATHVDEERVAELLDLLPDKSMSEDWE